MIAMTTLEAQELSAKLKVPAPAKYSLVSGVNKAAFLAAQWRKWRLGGAQRQSGGSGLKESRAGARAGGICLRSRLKIGARMLLLCDSAKLDRNVWISYRIFNFQHLKYRVAHLVTEFSLLTSIKRCSAAV